MVLEVVKEKSEFQCILQKSCKSQLLDLLSNEWRRLTSLLALSKWKKTRDRIQFQVSSYLKTLRTFSK